MTFLAEVPVAPEGAALLIPLGMLFAYCVARGMIGLATIWLKALFGVAEKGASFLDAVTGWVPWVGGKAKAPIEHIEHRVIHALTQAAANVDSHIALYFHRVARIITAVGEELAALSLAQWELVALLFKKLGVAAVGPRLDKLYARDKAHAQRLDRTAKRANAATKAIDHARTGRLGAATHAAVHPVAAELGRLEGLVLPRIKTLEREAEHGLPADIAGLRSRAKALERGLGRAWSRIRGLEKATVGIGAAALVALALRRLGLSWLRCSNWKRLGRDVCRADVSLIEDLLLGTLAIVGTISIVEFAKELQGEMELASKGIHALVRE